MDRSVKEILGRSAAKKLWHTLKLPLATQLISPRPHRILGGRVKLPVIPSALPL